MLMKQQIGTDNFSETLARTFDDMLDGPTAYREPTTKTVCT